MKIVIFGLSVSSAWGNGHATLLRGLFRALNNDGHQIHFFERDTPYYAAHRDAESLPFADLHYYSDWDENLSRAKQELSTADVAMVTSYCPDGVVGVRSGSQFQCPADGFLRHGHAGYIGPVGTRRAGRIHPDTRFGGLRSRVELYRRPGTRIAFAINSVRDAHLLYTAGWIRSCTIELTHAAGLKQILSYLGTYSPDRQAALEELLIEPARQLEQWPVPDRRSDVPDSRSLAAQYPAFRARVSPRAFFVLFILATDTQYYASLNGIDGLLSFRAFVRGCSLRNRCAERLVGWPRPVFPTR